MPAFGPIKHRDLIRCLTRIGFSGPHVGGKHMFMTRGVQRVIIPNPHRGDISVSLLSILLSQAGVSREDWEAL